MIQEERRAKHRHSQLLRWQQQNNLLAPSAPLHSLPFRKRTFPLPSAASTPLHSFSLPKLASFCTIPHPALSFASPKLCTSALRFCPLNSSFASETERAAGRLMLDGRGELEGREMRGGRWVALVGEVGGRGEAR